MTTEQTTHVHLDVPKADKARWVKASQRRSAKLGEYLLGLVQIGEAHEKAALGALHGLGEGVPEYNRGVLTALGHHDLYAEWNFARIEVDQKVGARDALLSEEQMATWEEPDTPEWREACKAVTAAQTRKARAWEPIEALRQKAIAALDLSQWLP